MTVDLEPSIRSIADVAEKLMAEYEDLCSPATVSEIVLGAHHDLLGQVPVDAMAELLYQLARQRLGSAPTA